MGGGGGPRALAASCCGALHADRQAFGSACVRACVRACVCHRRASLTHESDDRSHGHRRCSQPLEWNASAAARARISRAPLCVGCWFQPVIAGALTMGAMKKANHGCALRGTGQGNSVSCHNAIGRLFPLLLMQSGPVGIRWRSNSRFEGAHSTPSLRERIDPKLFQIVNSVCWAHALGDTGQGPPEE